MFPKDNPEIILYAAMKKPSNSGALSKMVTEVIKNTAKYLNIAENDNSGDLKSITVSSYINKDVSKVVEKLKKENIEVVVLGDGDRVIAQSKNENELLLEGEKIILKTNSLQIYMPSIYNWSRTDVISLCNLLGIDYSFEGYGFVKEQSIPKGNIVTKDLNLEVVLKSKL